LWGNKQQKNREKVQNIQGEKNVLRPSKKGCMDSKFRNEENIIARENSVVDSSIPSSTNLIKKPYF
jgi:hypothetical protein